jgi:hypothetical protein
VIQIRDKKNPDLGCTTGMNNRDHIHSNNFSG